MILSDTSIYELLLRKDQLSIDAMGKDAIQPCSIDLRMGHELFQQKTAVGVVGRSAAPQFDSLPSRSGDRFVLQPGQFYLANTLETIRLGDQHALKLEGKSTWGRRGLEVHSTAGWVDPGFQGQLTLEMKVVGVEQVEVFVGEFIAQICVFQLDRPAARPYGHISRASKYQGQRGPTGPRVKAVG